DRSMEPGLRYELTIVHPVVHDKRVAPLLEERELLLGERGEAAVEPDRQDLSAGGLLGKHAGEPLAIDGQRLFHEYVLLRPQRGPSLRGVLVMPGDDEDRVEMRIFREAGRIGRARLETVLVGEVLRGEAS